MLVRRADSGWENADPVSFANEAELQALVQETFEEILAAQSDAPAVIVREVAMPDHGRIDILAIDADGVITICECKLASNADIRRKVLGQVLEYAGWLNEMPFHDFRARIEGRLPIPFAEAMAEKADDDWDRDTWIDEISIALAEGRFRIMVAVDEIGETLKQTLLYLNAHSQLPVMAATLERGRYGDVEVLVPTVFAGEVARRNTPTSRPSSTVEDADVAVVAATLAFGEYERHSAYICQPNRSFRDGATYLGFYAKRRIEAVFPKILGFHRNLEMNAAQVTALRETGDPVAAKAADVLEALIADVDDRREPERKIQIIVLDIDQGFELRHPIRHEGGAAWVRGQRYTSSRALQTDPATTDELQAAGG